MVEWTLYSCGEKMRNVTMLRSDIFIDNVGTEEQRQELKNTIFNFKNTHDSMANSNDGCWRGDVQFDNMNWLEEAIIKRLEQVINFYLNEDASYAQRYNPQAQYVESWVNVNESGSSNRIHAHSDYDFVALYFIQGTDTGSLTMHNPANLLHNCSLNSPFVSRYSFDPKDGDLYIWPAWMPHEVEINNSERQRINITFNIKV